MSSDLTRPSDSQTSVLGAPVELRRVVIIVQDEKLGADSEGGGGALIGGIIGGIIGGPWGALIGAGLGASAGSEGPSNILRVGVRDASAHLWFPPGHPLLGESYALHPFHNHAYLPLGSFHRTLREAKHAELMQLLVALGAVHVRARVAETSADQRKGSAEVSVPGAKIGGRLSTNRKTGHDVVFEERYDPRVPPHVPNNLVWLPHEPSWLGLLERRLHYGTLEATAVLEYVDDYGIEGAVAGKVKGIGGKISGGFREIERITWELDVTFRPLSEFAPPPQPHTAPADKPWWKLW